MRRQTGFQTCEAIFFIDRDLAIAVKLLLQQWVIAWMQLSQYHAILLTQMGAGDSR
ncbi:Uncharacterised protein [Vibrio cholerae]|nr:Uncharacterised protein [Vibrio cholerae]